MTAFDHWDETVPLKIWDGVVARAVHGEEATLVEHLDELRTRLLVALAALAVTTAVAYVFRGHLLHWLNQPLPANKRKPVTFGVAEPFLTSLMVSLYAGLLLALPVIFWQVWSFLAPAFVEHTQRVIAGFVAFSLALLAAGVVFGYFVVLPAAVHFLTSYDQSHYTILIRARDYYGFVTLTLLAIGVVFQVPVLILALTRLGVTTPAQLRKWRRYAILIAAVIAANVTGGQR